MTFLSGLTTSFASSAVSAAATAAPPTAVQFQGWSAGAQAAYLTANSADHPPFLVIGDPGGAQILATLGFDGQTVTTASVPASYAEAASSGTLPRSDDFARWDPELQLAYVRASGVTPPSALVLGNATGPQSLVALNWNDTGVATTPVPASYAAAVSAGTKPTAAAFEGWPQQLQLAYLLQRGTGTPLSVIVGDPAQAQVLAALGRDGASVVASSVPQSYSALALAAADQKRNPISPAPVLAPSGGAAQAWDPALQLGYLQSVCTDVPPFLVVGDPSGAQSLLTLGADKKSLALPQPVPASYSKAASTRIPPTADAFETWPSALQLSYLRAQPGAASLVQVLAPDSAGPRPAGDLVTLSSDGRSAVTIPLEASVAAAMKAYAAVATPPSPLPSLAAFQAWTPQQQMLCLQTQGVGSPPALVLDAGDADAALVMASPTDPSALVAAPMADVFGGWAAATQLAFVKQNGTGTPPSVVFGSGQGAFTAALNPTGTAVTVTKGTPGPQNSWGAATVAPGQGAAAGTSPASAPAALSPAAFASWTGSAQAAYLTQQSPDTPACVVVGDPAQGGQVLATTLANGGVFTTAVPASYSTALASGQPPSLADFQGWANALQIAYLRAAGTGSPASITLGTGNLTVTATLGGGGVTVTSSSAAATAGVGAISISDYLKGNYTITPQVFFALPQDQQAILVQNIYQAASNWPENPPPSRVTAALSKNIHLGPEFSISQYRNSLTILPFSTKNGTFNLTIPPDQQISGLYIPLSSPGSLDVSDFSTWPPQFQSAFVQQHGLPSNSYPKSLVLNGQTATLLSASDQVQTSGNPADFESTFLNGTPSLATFLSWPSACQQALVAKLIGSDPTKSFSLSSSLGAVQVVATTTAVTSAGATATTMTGWKVQTAPSNQTPPPTAAALALLLPPPAALGADALQVTPPAVGASPFQTVVPPAVQAAYLAKYGTGIPPIVKVGSGAATSVMSSPSAATGQAVTLLPLPAGYATSPKLLDAAAFAGWPPSVQQIYVLDNGSGTPRSVTVGPNGKPQVAASLTAAGALVTVLTPAVLSVPGATDAATLFGYSLLGGTGGLSPSGAQATAAVLFPVLNGDPAVAGSTILPTDPQTDADKALVAQFNTPPSQLDAAVFSTWNSAIQLQYLRANAGYEASDGTLAIGVAGGAAGVVHVFMAAPTIPQTVQQKVYTIENLQKSDIAKMALADQRTLAATAAFQAIALSLNLVPDGVTAVAPGQTGVDALGNPLPTALGLVQAQIQKALSQIADPTKLSPAQPDGMMPAADKQIYTDEIGLIAGQLGGSAIFSPTDVQTQIDTIVARYTRANAFSCCVNVPGQRSPDVSLNSPTVAIPIDSSYIYLQTSLSAPIDQVEIVVTDPSVKGGDPVSDSSGAFIGKKMTIADYISDNKTQPLPADQSVSSIVLPAGTLIYPWTYVPNTGTFVEGSQRNISPVPYTGGPIQVQFTRTTGNPASIDNNATINAGYSTFITQEKQVLQLAQRAQSIATTGRLTTQDLDGPNLVYLFMLFANLTGEAVVRMDTEEVSQTNALLQMYSAMQQAVQQAIQSTASDPTNTSKTASLGDSGSPTGPSSDLLKKLFTPPSPQRNPIEILKNIPRAVNTSTAGDPWTQDSQQWNSYNQQLSTAVSSINQDSQIKMNDINDETKQKDREFDLANTALQKAQDAISKIASM